MSNVKIRSCASTGLTRCTPKSNNVHDNGTGASEWFKGIDLDVTNLVLLSLANSKLIESMFGKKFDSMPSSK